MAQTTTLQDYLNECRLLLHDANSSFFSDQDLTTFINEARMRYARDSACLRQLQPDNTVTGQEVYTFASLPNGANTYDVINLTLYWGDSRIQLAYMAWTDFAARMRYRKNYQGRPIAYSMYQPGMSYYLGPVPDQVYALELDTSVRPVALQSATDIDQIPDSYTSPVAFYACHRAKFKQQAFGEAAIFKQEYDSRLLNVLSAGYQRRIYSPYGGRF